MSDENKKTTTSRERLVATFLKIFICSIPVAIVLTIINKW